MHPHKSPRGDTSPRDPPHESFYFEKAVDLVAKTDLCKMVYLGKRAGRIGKLVHDGGYCFSDRGEFLDFIPFV